MVIGGGLMAKAFNHKYRDLDNTVIFASGVANSKETNQIVFQREVDLLRSFLDQNEDRLFVYFSTCSIYDPQQSESPYVTHKLKMEELVAGYCSDYLICRVSNVVGHTENRQTVFNFLVDSVRSGTHFTLWRNAVRNIIDVDDVAIIVEYIITHREDFPKIVNVANPNSYVVSELVETMEAYFGSPANCTKIEAGLNFVISVLEVSMICEKVHLDFHGPYIQKLLKKYYPL